MTDGQDRKGRAARSQEGITNLDALERMAAVGGSLSKKFALPIIAEVRRLQAEKDQYYESNLIIRAQQKSDYARADAAEKRIAELEAALRAANQKIQSQHETICKLHAIPSYRSRR